MDLDREYPSDGFSMAKRDVVTIGNLVDHMRIEGNIAYQKMLNLKESNRVYSGNQNVLDQLEMMLLINQDISSQLYEDKKTLGIIEKIPKEKLHD